MNIEFDKRINLILGLQCYVNNKYNCEWPWVRSTYPKYDDEFLKLCDNYLSNEFEEYIKNGGLDSYSRTIRIALSLNDKYEVTDNDNIKQIKKMNEQFNSNLLSKYLQEFVNNSNYDLFYDSTLDERNMLINKMDQAINAYTTITPSMIEDFYGFSKGTMKIILANFSRGSYGETTSEGSIYVAGLNSYKDDKFEPYIIGTLCHEFSHPYMNPLGYKYFKDIKLDYLYNNSKENGLQECYDNATVVINEYMVRAVQIYLPSKYFEKEITKKIIERHKSIGFPFVEEIIELFKLKDNYPSFEEFYKNEIVNYFINLNERIKKDDKTR